MPELGRAPVFAVPSEFAIQSAVESYNNRWQQKVWQRFSFSSVEEEHWDHRLVRGEVHIGEDKILLFGLRRAELDKQPLLNQWEYHLPEKRDNGE